MSDNEEPRQATLMSSDNRQGDESSGPPEADRPCIEVEGLDKWYKRGKVKALDGISLSVGSAEIFGLIGPNGAGKTTLMQCLLGIVRPTRGAIKIDGLYPEHLKVKEKIAFLPERPIFDGWMTARQFLRYHHMLAKQPFKDGKRDVEEALDLVQLDPAARDRRVTQFSRGMLQRVGLAQMLVGKPSICFLDEPTSGMDPLGMQLVRDMLLYWKSRGVTVILNSHHLDEVEKVCDRVAFIKAGKIQSIERIQDIQITEIRVIVKWIEEQHDSSLKDKLVEIADSMSISLDSFEPAQARFTLNSRADKASLIRRLVEAEVLIEEVVTEKRALKELFVERVSGTADNGSSVGEK